MTIAQYLITVMKKDVNDVEWASLLKHMELNYPDVEKWKCDDGFDTEMVQKSLTGYEIMGKRPCVLCCTEKGILLLCPSVSNLPYTILLTPRNIRVVKSETKLLKAVISIVTDDGTILLYTSKKTGIIIEKAIDKVWKNTM